MLALKAAAFRLGRAAAVTALLAAPACRQPPGQEPAEKRYDFRGRVVSVNRAVREAIVSHDEIPGLMDAMTMPFPIADDLVLAELRPGDTITASLRVGETGYRLEKVVVGQHAAPGEVQAPATAAAGAEPEAGALLPDVRLTDQDGKTFRLSDYRGSPLAITFIFTRCPLPDFCPRMLSHFAAVDRALAGRPEPRSKARLLAVSFDPDHDTPAVLRAYGQRFLGPTTFARVALATGGREEVKALARSLGLDFEEEGGQFTHNLRTAVLAPDGTLFRLLRGNDWTPEQLLGDLDAAQARAKRAGGQGGAAQPPPAHR